MSAETDIPTTEETTAPETPAQSYQDYKAGLANPAPEAPEPPPSEPPAPEPKTEEDRRPYRAAKPVISTEEQIAALRAELARVSVPPSKEPPAPPAPPEPKGPPTIEEFRDPKTGLVDDKAFTAAVSAYAREEALAAMREELTKEQTSRQEREAQAAIEREDAALASAWLEDAKAMTADKEHGADVREALAWISSDEVATKIHPDVQRELMRAGPAVAYILAQRPETVQALQANGAPSSGYFVGAYRAIANAKAHLDSFRAPAEPTTAPAPAAPPPRTPQGQFQARGPVDVAAGAATGTGSGESYQAYKARMTKERFGG